MMLECKVLPESEVCSHKRVTKSHRPIPGQLGALSVTGVPFSPVQVKNDFETNILR